MLNKRRRRRCRKSGNWFSRLSMGKKVAVCICGLLICLLTFGVIFVSSKFGKMETKKIKKENIIINELPEEVGEGYTNFALFGGDSRTGELEEGVRTDAIIIASLNNATKEIKMVSVYRDTLLDLSKGRINKCNGAYSEGGPEQAINMLNMNLDLDIQKYVTVDFKAVAETIDLLGGIEIDVSEAEVKATNEYIRETARVAGKKVVWVPHSGPQTLDGVQATTYARIRKGVGDDYARTERQRLVIEKMAEKAMKSDLGTINRIVDKIFPMISTNLTMPEILSYAKSFTKYKIGETQGFPLEQSTATLSGKGSCVIPITLETNVKTLHEFLYGTTEYQPSAKVVKISNAIRNEVGNRTPDPEPTYNRNEVPDNSSNNNSQGGNGSNQTPPPSNPGGGTTPPDQGGTTPPDEGGGTTPPDQGGTTPPDEGGGTTPPDQGGEETPPPDQGGGTTPPPEQGTGETP